jgi:hypothetical protein
MPTLPAGSRIRSDFAIGCTLFLASAAFVYWQNSQVAVLWDLSYLLDTSWRIALGQTPYRDFPLVHPPLTFLIQALIMRVAGRFYLWPVAYATFVSGLGTVIAWRIVLRIFSMPPGWIASLLLAAPLIFLGIYGVYPHPIYDCDCGFAVLIAVFLLQRYAADSGKRNTLLAHPSQNREGWGARILRVDRRWFWPALTGAAVVLPVFFKQNIGLPFLLCVVAGLLLLLMISIARRGRPGGNPDALPMSDLLRLMVGIGLSASIAIALIHFAYGIDNYLQWTVRFAAQRRLPGFADMLAVYRQPSFVWTLPTLGIGLILLHARLAKRLWLRLIGFLLVSAPFVGSLIFLLLDDDLDERGDNLLSLWPMLLVASGVMALFALRKGITLSRLIPFFVLAAIHGTFLSQQLWGSTYAIWPLLIVLVAQILAALPAETGKGNIAITVVISATFLICGGLYAAGHERLNYIQIPNEPIHYSNIAALRGMSIRGPYLPDFDELVRFADEKIPPQDGILLLSGEEPFFYATGRSPHFAVQIFDRTTDPYSPQELFRQARDKDIRWVVIKTRLQSNEDPLPERETTLDLMRREFVLDRSLGGYDVYRRR